MNNKEYYEELLIKGEIEKALSEILIFSESIAKDSTYHDFLILYSRWNRNKEQQLGGRLTFDQCKIEENQILDAFLQNLKKVFN